MESNIHTNIFRQAIKKQKKISSFLPQMFSSPSLALLKIEIEE